MMQPESQALVREFTRRLKAALSGAPNHIRLEASLEVESHVQDVLSRHPGEGPEPERVGTILAGFGSPEEYARALVEQVPAVQATTVRGGVREVTLAIADLVKGIWRLGVAVARQGWAAAVAGVRLLRLILSRGAAVGIRLLSAMRGPAAHTSQWLVRRGRGVLRGATRAAVLGQRAAGVAAQGGRLARRGAAGVWAAARWVLRAAGMAVIAAVALLAFALAGFGAMAPDLVGWAVFVVNHEIGLALDHVRRHTVWLHTSNLQASFSHTGYAVVRGSLALGLVLLLLLGYILWQSRRRRAGTLN